MPVWRDEMVCNKSGTSTLVSGLLIAGIGLVLLLDRFGIVNSNVLWRLWPLIFCVGGIIRVAEFRSTKDQVWGAFLISIGGLLTLHEFGYIHFGIGQLWPLFLIVAGLLMAWHANEVRGGRKGISLATPAGEGAVHSVAFFGGIERKLEGKYFQGGNITALFGGFKIDLTRAEMDGSEAIIYANAVFGGGEIIAPEAWRVSVEGVGIFGGYVDKTRYVPRTDSPIKTLHVRGSAVFGGIEVKSW